MDLAGLTEGKAADYSHAARPRTAAPGERHAVAHGIRPPRRQRTHGSPDEYALPRKPRALWPGRKAVLLQGNRHGPMARNPYPMAGRQPPMAGAGARDRRLHGVPGGGR